MKTLRILGLAAGGMVLLIALAALIISSFVDANQFKPLIETKVKLATGRQLTLNGDIKLSVFPWLALKLGPATLSSPPQFKDIPFLSFQQAQVRVKLLPLLAKHLEIAQVELDGLNLNLVKTPDGQANWQMTAAPETPASRPQPQSTGSDAVLDSFGGIAVTDGRVRYNQYVLDHLNLNTGSMAGGRDVPVTFSVDANRGVAGEQVTLRAKLTLRDNPGAEAYSVADFTLSGTLTRPGYLAPLSYEIRAPLLQANLNQQTLNLPQFTASWGAAQVSGKLSGTKIIDDPKATGSIELAPLALAEFAPRIGITLPKTQDPKALSAFSLATGFSYDATAATLDDIQIKLDDTTLKGRVKLAMGASQRVEFELAADRIDLDRYRPPLGSIPDPKSAAANQPAPKSAADRSDALRAQGTFTLSSAHAAGLDFTALSVRVDMKDHVTHLHPLEAQLYGGRYSGDLTYDARTATPSLSLDEHLSSVDLAQLLAHTKVQGRVSGKATLDLKGTARGAGADDILKTLDGHFDANISQGALEGVDLGYELALAQALFNQQAGTGVPDTHRTVFEACKLSAQITHGVAQTHDLTLASAVLKVAGQGSVNLPSSGLDLTLLASVMKSATTTAVDIPLKIAGTVTHPSVKPDLRALAKGEVKQKLQDVLKKNGVDLNSLFHR